MLFVLCRDPLEPARPDRSFQAEVAEIERLGLAYILVDHDALIRGDDITQVIRRIPERTEPVTAIYRGWMMTPRQYRQLYDALTGRNIRLINDPDQYRHCHYLPESYPIIADDLSNTACLVSAAYPGVTQQGCPSPHMLEKVVEALSGSGMTSSNEHRLVDGVVDRCFRRVLSLCVGPHGIDSWGRTRVAVTRRRSVSSR